MTKLNIANWVDCTEVEGPGKRFAIWVQGCLLRCPHCCNPHMFDLVPRDIMDINEILKLICAAKYKYAIEGVTFLGGEPMLQAKGLSAVASKCEEIGLSVVVFTGYTLDFLKEKPFPGVSELLSKVDILVDGAFVSSNPETQRNWAGSTNQKFHYLTDRYQSGIEFDSKYPHGFELRLFEDGTLRANGWPSIDVFNGLYHDNSSKIDDESIE